MSKFNIDSFMSATTTWKEIMLKNFNAALAEEGKDVPVAWMVYTLDGKSAFVTDNPKDFTQDHQALPLYTHPPQRKPLTDEEVIQMALEAGFERNSLGWTFTYGRLDYHLTKFARAIERAHGIGGAHGE